MPRTNGELTSWILQLFTCFALIRLVHSQHAVCVARGSHDSAHAYRAIRLRHPKHRVIISSPNFPRSYIKNAQCTWLITAPPDCTVKLSYLAFDVGEPAQFSSTCQDDYLVVSEDKTAIINETQGLRRRCGNSNPPDVRSAHRQLWIRFTSDSTTERTGFSLDIRPVCASSKTRLYPIFGAIFLSMLAIIIAVILCRKRPKHPKGNRTLSTQNRSTCRQASSNAEPPLVSVQVTSPLTQPNQKGRHSTADEELSVPLVSDRSPPTLAERRAQTQDGDHSGEKITNEQQALEFQV